MVAHPTEQDTTAEDWRLNALMALALINHRRTADGLNAQDTELVWQALNGHVVGR